MDQPQKKRSPVQRKRFSIDGLFFGKASTCVPILRSLPVWFGVEEAIIQYAAELDYLPTDENYARTRAFYLAMGFKPLEEFPQIWDKGNPWLIMIKRL